MNTYKKTISYFLSFCFLVVVLAISSCGGDSPEPSETEAQKATKLLIGTWTIQQVTVDGSDRSDIYKDLRITFSASSLSATNGGPVWPSTTSWDFTDDSGKTIVRGDGLNISVNELTNNRFVAALTWTKTTLNGGRENSVSGQHVFTFTK